MGISAKNIRVEVGPIPKDKKENTIYFASFEEMNKVLTSNRIELLNIIKREKPESIYRLAVLAERDQGNVTKDVSALHEHGFIDIIETKEGNRTRSEPRVDSEGIEMIIKLGAGVFGVAKDALTEVSKEFDNDHIENNKRYAKETYRTLAKPVKQAVKKVAKEFDIVTKDDE